MHGNNLWPNKSNKSSLEHLYFQVEKLYWLYFQPLLTFNYNWLDNLWECSFNMSHVEWKLETFLSLKCFFFSFFFRERETKGKILSWVKRSFSDFPEILHFAGAFSATHLAPGLPCHPVGVRPDGWTLRPPPVSGMTLRISEIFWQW